VCWAWAMCVGARRGGWGCRCTSCIGSNGPLQQTAFDRLQRTTTWMDITTWSRAGCSAEGLFIPVSERSSSSTTDGIDPITADTALRMDVLFSDQRDAADMDEQLSCSFVFLIRFARAAADASLSRGLWRAFSPLQLEIGQWRVGGDCKTAGSKQT
jgi:hypothetical protein